jgi:hypothetical protein
MSRIYIVEQAASMALAMLIRCMVEGQLLLRVRHGNGTAAVPRGVFTLLLLLMG